ncbi:septum formation family protein [Dactylosporangium darangshiense]|uniref:septum formation family protein n=1 Tax=Dactylosporangium darangshiense TaxID=579108 RepID=UPI0031E90B4E
MRRRLIALTAVLVLGALSGCAGQPAGTDGDLGDDWAMLPAAKVPEPVLGECHNSGGYKDQDVSSWDGVAPVVPCDGPHQVEIVAVGKVPAELAKEAKRPDRDKFAALYAQCEEAAAKYLGGDWHAGRLYLYLQPPTYAQWLGGLRTYHCDVAVMGADGHKIESFDKTFKGAVAPGGPLANGCSLTSGATNDTLFAQADPVACTQPHDLEYAGYVTAPADAAFPNDTAANEKLFGKACEAKMLEYTGMSRTAYNRQRDVYYIWWRTAGSTGWKAGDHSSRCFFFLHGRKLSKSVKGIGDATL